MDSVTVQIPVLEITVTQDSITRLDNLVDVSVDSPVEGQVLIFEDGSWKNGNPTISGSVDWNAVTNKPEEFPAESHTHTISEVVGLQDALDNVSVGDHDHDDRYYTKTEVDAALADKAEANHSHAISELSDVSVSGVSNGQVLSYQDGIWVPGTVSGGGGPVSYTDLLDVPSEFPPEAHSHTTDEVTGLAAALAGKASVTHSHSISDVTGLQAALDAKQDASEAFSGSYNDLTDVPSTFTPATHSHTVADVTGLQTALDGKAASSHSHAISDITGLQAAIDQKLDASSAFSGSYEDLTDVPSTFTPSIHSHEISEVTGLQTALDGKASVSHSHDISDVTGLQTALDGKAASTHSHVISDITGLQTALDDKAAVTHNHDDRYYTESEVDNLLAGVAGKDYPITEDEQVVTVGDRYPKMELDTGNVIGTKPQAVRFKFNSDWEDPESEELDNDLIGFFNLSDDGIENVTLFVPTIHQTLNNPNIGAGIVAEGRVTVKGGLYVQYSNIALTGVTTFSGVPTPTSDSHAANKKYVDDAVSGVSGSVGIPGQTGGTDGRVIRLTTTDDTWTDASNTDTLDQLSSLAFKQDGKYYPYGSVVTGLSNLTAGTVYYLSTSGQLTSTAPTPSSSVALVRIGTAINTTSLYFTPGIPIGGE